MNIKINRGFTLIELLVVIAIIGILSAVVLASLSTARNRANDVSVKANLDTVKTQASLFFSENGNSYGDFNDGSDGPANCPTPGTPEASLFGNETVENAIAAAIAYTPVGGVATCFSSPATYMTTVSRPMIGDVLPPSTYWCVDSAGQSCGIDALPTVGSCGETCIRD
jgi:prepilin-type N-terminal cleavage/methylation domain-containing protein